MKVYSIFDDFPLEATSLLENAGVMVTVHPHGVPRPEKAEMKSIFEEYDGVIIGTSQKMVPEIFENIKSNRVIATASVGLDHIHIPEDKKEYITVFNTPKANAQSVAEYTLGCALACVKRFQEGNALYIQGKNNKYLSSKPEDLSGKTFGVIGAGNISIKIMEYAMFFGGIVICWTAHPEKHADLLEKGVKFVSLEELVCSSDIISVNLPNKKETENLISGELVSKMKDSAVFISVSRLQTVDYLALFNKAIANKNFYVCLDIDLNDEVVQVCPVSSNVLVTPHIAGGTVETRRRMFMEVASQVAGYYEMAKYEEC